MEMREFIKEWLTENENAVQQLPKKEVIESSINSPNLSAN